MTDQIEHARETSSWWKEAVVYQIYPQSFNDSDKDGIGDIPGIIEKVEYLNDLGIDCVWLNPVYESPKVDNGYDISNYRAIDSDYGTMDDWERLINELHARDIRLIMDLVVNHTSDKHVWFQRSRQNDNEYSNYYHWRSPNATGERPNNWESFFDTPAWSYDETREAYYLHLFSDRQPDLNWTNPDVREEICDIISWWLERDIDGFRMDVINLISKTEGLPDGDPDSGFLTGSEHFTNGPQMHEYFSEIAEKGYGEEIEKIMTVGECIDLDPETAIDVTGRQSEMLDMVFYFDHLIFDRKGRWKQRDWELTELKDIMATWQDAVKKGAWVSLFLSNHDQPRHVSRFGDEEYRYESATMLATWLHAHKGTPFIYQGEEIGMTNTTFDTPDQLRDVWAKNYWLHAKDEGKSFETVRPDIEQFGRDNARTPMQWSDTKYAGFSDAEPWIHVDDDYKIVNVKADRQRERSVFNYYQSLIKLRHENKTLIYGDFELLFPNRNDICVIKRYLNKNKDILLIMCNFTDKKTTVDLTGSTEIHAAETLLCNYPTNPSTTDTPTLRPYEARIYG